MHLFLRKGKLAPAEIGNRFGSMGKGLQRPEPDHSVPWRDVVGGPVHRSWLLFHDPPAAMRGGTVQIMMKGLEVRVSGAGECQPVVAAKQVAHLVEKTQWIGIPRGYIDLRAKLEMIKIGDPAHEVMDDGTPW